MTFPLFLCRALFACGLPLLLLATACVHPMPRDGEDLSTLQENPMGSGRMVHFDCTSDKLWLGYDQERIQGSYRRREDNLIDGLQWLVKHQSADGSWNASVADTGLATLALRSRGRDIFAYKQRKNRERGLMWLRKVQQDNALFEQETGTHTMFGQAVATLSLGHHGRHPSIQKMMPPLVDALSQAQGPHGAWSFELPPSGKPDLSTTAWAVSALLTAKYFGAPAEQDVYDRAEEWFASSQDSKSLTAVALYARLHMADTAKLVRWTDHPDYALFKKQAQLLATNPPVWNEASHTINLNYWYYGTLALYRWGGEERATWMKALGEALIPHQRLENEEDDLYGSWDPAGVNSKEGGRIHSTALCSMMLDTYYLATALHVRKRTDQSR